MTTTTQKSKVILVTGASTGIGAYLVNYYLKKSFKVIATARTAADLKKLSAMGAHSIFCEMSDPDSISSCVAQIQTITAKLDCLVNNAAFGQAGAVVDLSFATLQHQFNVNVFGTIELTRLLMPLIEVSGAGKVIFISSILGVVTAPYLGAYSASKYALESLVSAMRMEYNGKPIGFSSIRPGQITSNFRSTAENVFNHTIAEKDGVDLLNYTDFMRKAELNKQKNRGRSPDLVAKVVDRIISAKRPRCAYYVTPEAHFMGRLQRFIPQRLVEWVMRRYA